MTRYPVGPSVVAILLALLTAPGAAQAPELPPRWHELATTERDVGLIVNLVLSGFAVGYITEASEASATNLDGSNSAFRKWYTDGDRTAFFEPSQREPISAAQVPQVLTQFVSRRAGRSTVTTRPADRIPVLTVGAVDGCERVMAARVAASLAGDDLIRLAQDTVRASTGAEVPSGYLGSCVPGAIENRARLGLAAQSSVRSALSSLVSRAGGGAWVAIQQSDGACSIGLVLKSATGAGVCSVDIATIP
jgi:hypothetical protein